MAPLMFSVGDTVNKIANSEFWRESNALVNEEAMATKAPTVQLINHASVRIANDSCSLLTDPWYAGTAFHRGWSLLEGTSDEEVEALLAETDYIWVSHEHPDHFVPGFFMKHQESIKSNGIVILFQKTDDRRVAQFLEDKGFKLREIAEKEVVSLASDFKVSIEKVDFYDSALIAEVSGKKIFNINDCPLRTDEEILGFKQRHGSCDLLLTQFSYAAWKGGKENRSWRREAAAEKLQSMEKQSRLLEAKEVIPFASFVYFSNQLNSYLNEDVNTPNVVWDFAQKHGINSVMLKKGETQEIGHMHQDDESIKYWQAKFSQAAGEKLPQTPFERSFSLSELKASFEKYRERMFRGNSRWMMWFAQKLPLLGAFQPLNIKLLDLDKTVKFDIVSGRFEESQEAPDVSMHSESLCFVFDQDFGFDTLTVSGCFESSMEGFKKMSKHLALGNLNCLGIYLSPGIFFRFDIIMLFFDKLRQVSKKMKAKKQGATAG